MAHGLSTRGSTPADWGTRFAPNLMFCITKIGVSLKTGTVAHEKASNATFSLRCQVVAIR
jgi:hypothetical protein